MKVNYQMFLCKMGLWYFFSSSSQLFDTQDKSILFMVYLGYVLIYLNIMYVGKIKY